METDMQLEQAVEGFMEGFFSTRRRSEKTRTAYKTDLAQLQTRFGSERPVSMIDADSLEKWAGDLRSSGYAPVSIRRKFATVRVLFAYWVRKGIIDSSPLWKIRLDLGRQRLLPRSLSENDMKRLIECMWRHVDCARPVLSSSRDRGFLAVRNVAIIEILFATGIRVGELASLTCQDWREDEASFLVMGKGLRQRFALLPDERSQRAMRTYLKHRVTMTLGHDALLVNAAGRKLSSQGIARTIAMAAKDCDIKRRVTPHMIRHTVGTLLLRCGADIRVVQEVLGHASIVTTQRYTHVSREQLTSTLKIIHPNHHINIEVRQSEDAQLLLPLH
jgi:site-specific recombinase XerD